MRKGVEIPLQREAPHDLLNSTAHFVSTALEKIYTRKLDSLRQNLSDMSKIVAIHGEGYPGGHGWLINGQSVHLEFVNRYPVWKVQRSVTQGTETKRFEDRPDGSFEYIKEVDLSDSETTRVASYFNSNEVGIEPVGNVSTRQVCHELQGLLNALVPVALYSEQGCSY